MQRRKGLMSLRVGSKVKDHERYPVSVACPSPVMDVPLSFMTKLVPKLGLQGFDYCYVIYTAYVMQLWPRNKDQTRCTVGL